MGTAAQPDMVLSIPAVSPLGKAIQQVMAMEVIRDRKLTRWRDTQAFIAPYSSAVEAGDLAYERNAENVIETSIFFARKTLAAFFASAMTNPSRVWFEWQFRNPDLMESEAAKQFLRDLNERAFIIKSQSNFYDVMTWNYEEWPTFATSCILIEEDEADVVRYVPFPIGSYALADDHKGRCTAVSRRFEMTVRQIVERFATKPDGTIDSNKLSPRIKSLIDARAYEERVEICHLVCPNDAFNPIKQTPEFFRYASLYWEWGAANATGAGGGFLAREGYREWPFMVYRWKRIAGDPFGVDAPGIATLADVKSAQQMESDKLMGIEKLVKPPMVAPADAGTLKLLPGSTNKIATRTGSQVGPIHETAPVAIQVIGMEQDRLKERIYQHWNTRLVLGLTATEGPEGGRDKTATEVNAMSQERMMVLGPVVESASYPLSVDAERLFAIMARRGFLPPVPPELEGEPLVIKYTSMLALALRSVGLSSLREYGYTQAEMFKLTGDPAILRRTDWSEWAQEVGDHMGISPNVQRSDEEVEAIARAEAEAIARQQKAEQDALEARTVKDLGTTPMNSDSALDALAGQGAV